MANTNRTANPESPPISPHLTQIAFPFSVTQLGRTALADQTSHIRQLIRQVLFTSPGERVNQPSFGCNLQSLVFAARRNELTIAAETMVQGALQRWLGNLIQVEAVEITFTDNAVTVDLRYKETRTQQSWFIRFFN